MSRLVWLTMSLTLLGCPSKAKPGDPCRSNDVCSSLERGYCAKIEIGTRACDEAAPCPPAAACVSKGTRQVCLATCTGTDDCTPGFVCREVNGTSVCESADPLAAPPV